MSTAQETGIFLTTASSAITGRLVRGLGLIYNGRQMIFLSATAVLRTLMMVLKMWEFRISSEAQRITLENNKFSGCKVNIKDQRETGKI